MAADENLHRLRLLSYNIQAGVDTQHYRQYVTQGWKHLLPHRDRISNLNRIAPLLGEYDLVGLQEVDAGSLRTGFVDQTEYLAARAGFPIWHKQINRNLGKLAQYSNGLLSKLHPRRVSAHRLPGLPGRGAMIAEFGPPYGFAVCILHLALGRRARLQQVDFVANLLQPYRYVVVMGDLNCGCDSAEVGLLMSRLSLQEPTCDMSTFPSWRPIRKIDHILASQNLKVERPHVLDFPVSDHLPIGIDLLVPGDVLQRDSSPRSDPPPSGPSA